MSFKKNCKYVHVIFINWAKTLWTNTYVLESLVIQDKCINNGNYYNDKYAKSTVVKINLFFFAFL